MKAKSLFAALTLFTTIASADTYKIDPSASSIKWLAGKKIGSTHNGEVKIKDGKVETDKKGNVTSLDVVVDMKSISNEDLVGSPEYHKKLLGHLASDDFFKVDQFPDSTFKLTSFAPQKGKKNEYLVKGELTMIGKTQPIEFKAKMDSDKGQLKGTAKVKIERLKWGLQYGSGSIFKSLTADKIINDSFDLTLNLVANK